MGHEYIDIGTFHLRLNDFDIWTLRHFLCDTVAVSTPDSLDTDSDTLHELQSFVESWEWLGPGVVTGCDFNVFATSRSRLALVRSLLSATRSRITRFGELIPLDYLDEHINSPMAYCQASHPVQRFTEILDRLIALIPDGE